MILLLDIGNTHTHAGLANGTRMSKPIHLPTRAWLEDRGPRSLEAWIAGRAITGIALCSVVPDITPVARHWLAYRFAPPTLELTHSTIRGLGIDYPKPHTIGPDRLANAVAALHHHGAPSVVVDFGTAVTFDVVNRAGHYVGGVIAPGLAAMTTYLHEKTALLPAIEIRDVRAVIGKNTEEAMRIGAVHGYRGLIRELIRDIRKELGTRRLPIVATGGYAKLIAAGLPEITQVDPTLTLEGLRLTWQAHHGERKR